MLNNINGSYITILELYYNLHVAKTIKYFTFKSLFRLTKNTAMRIYHEELIVFINSSSSLTEQVLIGMVNNSL